MADKRSKIDEQDARRKRAYDARMEQVQEAQLRMFEGVAYLSQALWLGEYKGMRLREVRVYRKDDGSRDVGIVVKATTSEGRVVAFGGSGDLLTGLASMGERIQNGTLKMVVDRYQEKSVPQSMGAGDEHTEG